MPLINVRSSITILHPEEFLKELSNRLSELTGKPEAYVMTSLENKTNMTFGGNTDPCCFIEIKSIGGLKTQEISKVLCEYISSKTNISTNRIYIQMEDVQAKYWGWDSKTFG